MRCDLLDGISRKERGHYYRHPSSLHPPQREFRVAYGIFVTAAMADME